MKIAVIGAGGKAGSEIVKEALDRGHEVTAIVRSAAKLLTAGQLYWKRMFLTCPPLICRPLMLS